MQDTIGTGELEPSSSTAALPPGVRLTNRGLVLWEPWRPDEIAWLAYAGQAFAMVALPLGWIVSFFFIEGAVAVVLGMVVPLLLSIGFVGWLSRRGVPVRLRAGRVIRAGIPRAVARLRVRGEPGMPLTLACDGEPVLVLERDWTVEQTNAFVAVLARTTPIVDERDAQLWSRWASDPDFRATQQLERELAANQAAFPQLAAVPELPVRQQATLDDRVLLLPLRARGSTASVRLERGYLRAPGARVRRERVRRAFVSFSEHLGGRLANVCVWDGRQVFLVGQTDVDARWKAGRLKGLVREIEQWAAARAGRADEVPQALVGLLAR